MDSSEPVDELRAEIARLRARLDEGAARGRAIDPSIPAIAESLPDNIMLLDEQGRIQYINWTVPDLTPARVVGTPVTAYVPEAYREVLRRCLERARQTARPDRYETAYVSADGEVSYWESRVGPVVREGRVTGFSVISSNVSERRKAAADRDRFFNLSLDILAIISAAGHLTRINPAFERVTGYAEDELTSRPFLDFVHPDDRPAITDALARLAAGQAEIDFESHYRCKDGSYRCLSWRAIGDPDRRVVYGVGRDVTQQKELEVQVRHAQKMDAIGKLAGGVAHDFNNLLLAIRASAELAAIEASPDRRREHLDEIQRAVDRGAALTGQLLTFSRRQPANPVLLDANRVIREVLNLLRRLIPVSIELQFTPGPELPLVWADRGQVEQVLVNLCVNARDALPSGGRITIASEGVRIDSAFRASHPWSREGRYVRVSVTDNGMGMSPEVRQRAFEPFFTTKEPGKGTGLGLATVYGIVDQHGGLLHVSSEPAQGTTFDVYFPATERGEAPVGSELDRTVRGGSETILVAEDDEMVRPVVVRMLSDAGYKVLTARNGVEAVAVFSEHAAEIALALLDVVMPKRGGPAAAEEIRRQRADLPILFTSGYNEAGELQGTGGGAQRVLHKPYERKRLLRMVREALEAGGSAR